MTNGSIAITQGLLERANLEQYVTEKMDITQPQAWKPSPKAYHFAVKQLQLQPEQVRLLALHTCQPNCMAIWCFSHAFNG